MHCSRLCTVHSSDHISWGSATVGGVSAPDGCLFLEGVFSERCLLPGGVCFGKGAVCSGGSAPGGKGDV